jgi:hypothetical protein
VSEEAFPHSQELWQGAILGTIFHAVWIAQDSTLAYEQSWDGLNYNIQDSMGSRGTVTFSKEHLVGAIFDNNSLKNPFLSLLEYEVHDFFEGAPKEVLYIAESETLQYLLQEYKYLVQPVITAAFWSIDDRITASEPWNKVFVNGAHLLRRQLLDLERATMEWKRYYNMSNEQVSLVVSLFNRRVSARDSLITIRRDEVALIKAQGDDGWEEARELLTEIGFVFL